MKRARSRITKMAAAVCMTLVWGCQQSEPVGTTTTATAALTSSEESDLITKAWTALGGAAVVGNATAAAADLPSGVGRFQTFANGVIVWSNDNGAVLVPTAIFNFWVGLTSQQAVEDPTRTRFDYIGLPKNTSDSPTAADTVAWDAKANFDRGIIGVKGGQLFDVEGNIFARYAANPAKWGLPTGTPAHTNIPNLTSIWIGEAFVGGEIWTRGTPSTSFTTVELQAGPTFNFWVSTSLFGDPQSNIASDGLGGDFGVFTGGNIYSSSATGAVGVPSNPTDGNGHSLLATYTGLGGPASWLGYPTAPSGTSPGGAVFSSFQNGLLVMYPVGGGFAAPQPFGTLAFSWDSAQDTDSPGCFGFDPFGFCIGIAEGPFMQTQATVLSNGSPIAGPVVFPPNGSGCSESFIGFTLSSQSNVFCDGSQQQIGFTVPLGVAQGTSNFTVQFVSEGFSASLFSGSSGTTFGHLTRTFNIDNQFGQLDNVQQTAPDNGSYNFTAHTANAIPFSNTDFKGALWWSYSNFETATLPYTTYVDTFVGVAADAFNGIGSWGDKLYYDLVYKGSAANGNCFGMGLDSIDAMFGRRSSFNEPIHQFFGGAISTQDGQVLDPTANAAYAGMGLEINTKFGYQLDVDMINYALLNFIGAAASPSGTLDAVTSGLAANDHPLFSITSDFFFKNGHVIRPYQVGPAGVPCQTITGAGSCTQVLVLDPNIPSGVSSDTQFVEFSNDDRWAYNPIVNGSSFYSSGEYQGGSLSGGRIMEIPYSVLDHQAPTPVAEVEELLAIGAIIIFGDGTALNQVTDSSGRTLFNPAITGVPSRWEDLAVGAGAIPNMAPIPLGDPAPGAPTVVALRGLQSSQVYNVGLAPGQANGSSYEALFLSGLMSTDLVVPGSPGASDQITLNKLGTAAKSVAFQVPTGGAAKPISWTVTGPDKRRPIVLSQLMVHPAQQLTTLLENGAGRIKIENNGPATSATISLGNTTSDPVSAGTIQIPTGESGQDCSFTGATPVCAPMTLEEGSIFGFENPKAWTATGFPITTVSTPKTEGSFALQVGSSGFREIFSAVFSTSILTGITPKLALDVYLPAGPSNPFWLGAVQLYANCPSAGIYHAYQGEIELTGKPSGAFSTVTFNLASQVVAAMKAQHSDFSLSIAVNASPAQQSFVLDNLHFTQ